MHLCHSCQSPFELIARGNVKRELHIDPSLLVGLQPISKVAGQTHYLFDDVKQVALAHYGSLKKFLKADEKAAAKKEILDAKKFEKYKSTSEYRDKLIEAAIEKRAGEEALKNYSRKHIVWYSGACSMFSRDPTQGDSDLHHAVSEELRARILRECDFKTRWYRLRQDDFGRPMTYQGFEQYVLREWCEKHPTEYFRIKDRQDVFRFKTPL